jgi:predicted MFS family arabinose efflux permease
MQSLLERRPELFAALYTVSVVLPTFLTGAYAVRIQADMGFGTAELGYALSGFFVGGAIAARGLAATVDRIGASMALRFATVAAASSSITIAFANGWPMVWVGMMVAGVANGASQMASNRVLVSRTGKGREAMGFGTKQAAVPLASVAAGLTVSGLGSEVTWQAAFVAVAGLALAMSALVPRMPRKTLIERGVPTTGMRPRLVTLAVTGGLAGAAGNAISLLLVDSYNSWGLGERFGATMLGVGGVVAFASRLVTGWVVGQRRSDGRPELRAMFLASAAGFAVLASAGDSRPLLVGGTVLAFAAGWGWQGVIYFTATRDTSVEPAKSSGIVLSGVMAGSIAGPPLIAFSAAEWGYSSGWAVAGALSLAAAGLAHQALRSVGTAARA